MAMNRKEQGRRARKARIRKCIEGGADRPRLSVFRSSKYIYAQIIDDVSKSTLAACSSNEKPFRGKLKSLRSAEAAKEVGKELAGRAKAKNITRVVFDRNGYVYHGRVKALAEGAREAGLNF
jgi:large subunit ribosomal protein L18